LFERFSSLFDPRIVVFICSGLLFTDFWDQLFDIHFLTWLLDRYVCWNIGLYHFFIDWLLLSKHSTKTYSTWHTLNGGLSNSWTALVSRAFLFRIYLRYDYIVLGCWIQLFKYNCFLPRLCIYWMPVSHAVNDAVILYASLCIRNRPGKPSRQKVFQNQESRIILLITGLRGNCSGCPGEKLFLFEHLGRYSSFFLFYPCFI
jgi:hypothetical protein